MSDEMHKPPHQREEELNEILKLQIANPDRKIFTTRSGGRYVRESIPTDQLREQIQQLVGHKEEQREEELKQRIRELYEALASCQSWITDGGYETDPDVAQICDQARTALTKARGES